MHFKCTLNFRDKMSTSFNQDAILLQKSWNKGWFKQTNTISTLCLLRASIKGMPITSVFQF